MMQTPSYDLSAQRTNDAIPEKSAQDDLKGKNWWMSEPVQEVKQETKPVIASGLFKKA